MNGYPDLLVLDLEAAPARHGGNGNRLSTRDLNHIARSVLSVASVLQITGKGESVELRTFEGEEIEILQDVDQMLAAKPDHELVTFNGTHFDLPLLRIRSIVHHLFNLDSIGSLFQDALALNSRRGRTGKIILCMNQGDGRVDHTVP